MIVSKPKKQTLFSIVIFLVLTFGVTAALLYYWWQSGGAAFWYMLLATVSGSIGLAVLVRYFAAYKVLRIGKEKLELQFPFLFQHKRYGLKDLKGWREEHIKTRQGAYRELQIFFEGRKRYVRLSLQENTEYERVVGYLRKKANRKQLKS